MLTKRLLQGVTPLALDAQQGHKAFYHVRDHAAGRVIVHRLGADERAFALSQ